MPSSFELSKHNTRNQNKRFQNSNESASSKEESMTRSMTLEDAVEMLLGQFKETHVKIDDLRSDINLKIDTVKAELDKKLEAVSQDVNSLKEDCARKFQQSEEVANSIGVRMERITQSIGNLENRNELILSGIPFITGENLYGYFDVLCKLLELRGPVQPVVDMRRISSGKLDDGRDSIVLMQFSLKNARDDFYAAYLRKRDFKLSHLGFESDRRIFVNENLTVASRKIKAAAIRLKKSGKLVSVYTRGGIVYVKQTVDGAPKAIYELSHLDQLAK